MLGRGSSARDVGSRIEVNRLVVLILGSVVRKGKIPAIDPNRSCGCLEVLCEGRYYKRAQNTTTDLSKS